MKKISKLSIISLLLIICVVFLTACPDIYNNGPSDGPSYSLDDYDINNPGEHDYSYSDFGLLVNGVIKGCVEIKTPASLGSGFIIGKVSDPKYPIIITNYHVIKQAVSIPGVIKIKLGDKADFFNNNVKIMGYDADMDIAVLVLEKSIHDIDDRVLTWGNSRAIYKGQQIFAIGNSLGYGTSVTQGIISVTEENLDMRDDDNNRMLYKHVIRHSAAIISGNSGGALFNLNGEVIGVNGYGYITRVIGSDGKTPVDPNEYYNVSNMSLAIPSNLARAIFDYTLANYGGTAVDASAARSNPDGNFMDCLEHIESNLDSQDNNVLRVLNDKLEFLNLKANDFIIKINGWDINDLFFDSTQICTPSILLELCYYYSAGGSGDELIITVKRTTHGITSTVNINTGYRRTGLAMPDWIGDIQDD
jgi:S1-C subfamily serine protease